MNHSSVIPLALMFLMLGLGSTSVAQAPLISPSLSIGPSSGAEANVISGYSAAIGELNIIQPNDEHGWPVRGFVLGMDNLLTAGLDIAVLGVGNEAINGGGTILSGNYNTADSVSYTAVIGTYNFGWGIANSAIIGGYNFVYNSVTSLVVGENNALQFGALVNLFGKGLIGGDQGAPETIVGTYNVSSDATKPVQFVVANGAGAQPHQRNNAFVVYSDGDIVMSKRQGDILMGEFGN